MICRLTAKLYPKLGEYYNLLKKTRSVKASWPLPTRLHLH